MGKNAHFLNLHEEIQDSCSMDFSKNKSYF